MMMTMDSSAGLHLKLFTLTVMLCFSLLCGFSPVWLMRRAAHFSSDSGFRLRVLSLASCLSSGVFLASCLLDLLPDCLIRTRDTFSRLGITLHFPLAEFILAMGFLIVLVVEQVLLAFREQTCDVSHEKQVLIDCPTSDAPDRSYRGFGRPRVSWPESWSAVEDGRCHVGLRVFLLLFCLCVRALIDGLISGSQRDRLLQTCVTLLLYKGMLAFSLALRLTHYGLRRSVVSGCLLLFCLTCPAGMGLGLALVGTQPGAEVELVRCAVEGLTSGIFINVSIGGLMQNQESGSPKHRMHKVALLLTGFALVTAVLFSKV